MFDSSADFQNKLAAAIRAGQSDQGLDSERLSVYIRLIRNNIFNFIDRCFVETPQYLGEEPWEQLKEDFVCRGRAHTPYFQEIAGEFLTFCRSIPLSDGLLELMDFEYTQLLAEVAANGSNEALKHTGSYRLADTAFLRHYACDVTGELEENETALIVWRDPEDDVAFEKLDTFDELLLQTLSQTPLSLAQLETMLSEWMPSETDWKTELAARWEYWLQQGILTEASHDTATTDRRAMVGI